MECTECGAELQPGSYYCGCCGRPSHGGAPAATAVDQGRPDLSDLPDPGPSREVPATESRRSGYFICNLCMGAFPEGTATLVEGRSFCGDCSPVECERVAAGPGAAAPGIAEEPGSRVATRGAPPILRPEVAQGGWRWLVPAALLLAVGAVVAVGVGSLGQRGRIAEMMSGADRDRVDARLLVSKYEAGASLTYAASGEMVLTGDGPTIFGTSQDVDLRVRLRGTMRVDVLEVDDHGNAEVRISFEDFHPELSGDLGGPSAEVIQGLPLSNLQGAVYRVRVDAFGEALHAPERVDGGRGDGGFEDLFLGGMGRMPRHEVRVGDTWSATETNSLPGEGGGGPLCFEDLTMKAEYEVVGYKKVLGRDCMVIGMSADFEPIGDAFGEMGRLMGIEAEMAMRAEGVLFFDPHAGLMVKNAIDLDLDLGISSPQGSAAVSLQMMLDVDLR